MNFWKTFLASWLAIFVSAITLGVFGLVFLIAFISSFTTELMGGSTKYEKIKPNTTLVLDFEYPISDSKADNPAMLFDIYTFSILPNITSFEMVNTVYSAINDDNISQITLDMSYGVNMSLANIDELREALTLFRKSGKKVVAYSDHYTQTSYYLATIADEIYLCPTGAMEWIGLSSVTPFFKGLLDNIGVEVEIFKYGKYKSAVEPFILKGMSSESREQSERLMNNLWSQMVSVVSEARKISVDELNRLADELAINSPKEALNAGLIDGLKYYDEIKPVGNTRDFNEYLSFANQNNSFDMSDKKVEIIYAEGDIISGKTIGMGYLGEATLVDKINKAAKDRSVKSIVIRVNSPGGSALASDIINRAVIDAKKSKPVIVSMGATAASGGYYLAANADAIVASPFTITGSIGVFGLMFSPTKIINELGVSFDAVKTNKYSDMGGIHRSINDKERMFVQQGVNQVYEDFVNTVASGRKMTFSEVDNIAQGRVWTSTDAFRLGLIDETGGLISAIELAARMADLNNDYTIYIRSAQEDLFSEALKLLNSSSVNAVIDNYISSRNPAISVINKELSRVERLMNGDKIQAIIPYQINL